MNKKFKNRMRIFDSLALLEKDYPVYTWQFDGIQYWPILKTLIYFRGEKNWFRQKFTTLSIFQLRFFKNFITKKDSALLSLDELLNDKISERNCELVAIFAGAYTYSRKLEGYDYNMYFDPIMDQLDNSIVSYSFSYSKIQNENIYHKSSNVSLYNYFQSYHNNREKKLRVSSDLHCHLSIVEQVCQIKATSLEKEILYYLEEIISWKHIWIEIIRITNAKIAFGLCYYNEPMFGLILASYEMNIPFVDMQHGGQGKMHPAYSFLNFNIFGCNTMPFCFWVWHESSLKNIQRWINGSSHIVIEGGNPWLDFIKKNKLRTNNSEKKKILCTLTVGLRPVLPDYILRSILESNDDYIWLLRFHPRTPKKDKMELFSILNKTNCSNKVDIEEANNEQLPVLFSDAWAHVSYASGSLIEAAMFNVKRNVVTSQIGYLNNLELIDAKKVFYYNSELESRSLLYFLEELDFESNAIPNTNETNTKDGDNYRKSIVDIIKEYQIINRKSSSLKNISL